MPRAPLPLSVLDLVPISSGSNATAALHNTLDLAQHAEAAGYARYWIAEHHLNPGVAGTAPALVVSLVAGATRRIRVGSGAVQLGHHTRLSIRNGQGAIDFPTPAEAAAHEWSEDERNVVADRTATQFVGSPHTVADQLQILADETGADELLVTTITHGHLRGAALSGDGLCLIDGSAWPAQAEVVMPCPRSDSAAG